MRRILLIAVVLATGCTDSPTSNPPPAKQTATAAPTTPAKAPFKEPEPEIR